MLKPVSASGQFVGLAEMVGRVDFDNTVEESKAAAVTESLLL
jgi:hypothetical protein